jgi:hypothetical protein
MYQAFCLDKQGLSELTKEVQGEWMYPKDNTNGRKEARQKGVFTLKVRLSS